jgi:hypothetical protein
VRHAPAAALALVLLAAPGCGDNNTAPLTPCLGTFDGNVSGSGSAPNAQLSGCSFYTSGGFILTLGRPGDHQVTVATGGGRPVNGSYPIGSFGTADPNTGTFTFTGSTTRFFFSNSGTLTVTESVTGRVKGSLTMTMRESGTTPAVTATVTVNFDAPCLAQAGASC